MGEVSLIPIDRLHRRDGARDRSEHALMALQESIGRVGLLNPLTVRPAGDGFELIAGSHRLQACDAAGMQEVPCLVLDLDDIKAEMVRIAENMHRVELTKLERDVQAARWIELVQQKAHPEVLSQLGTKPLGGRPESGVRAAARELGIDKNGAYRAIKVASLSDDAKAAARTAGLDDNRSALLRAAKHSTAAAQVQSIQRHAERAHGGIANRSQSGDTVATIDPEPVDFDALYKRFTASGEWFLKADLSGLLKFLEGKGPRRAQALRLMSSLAEHLDFVREGASR